MNITKEYLQRLTDRTESENASRVEAILNKCLRYAIDGEDSWSCFYDENDQEAVSSLQAIASELKSRGHYVYFDGDEGNMYMTVAWW